MRKSSKYVLPNYLIGKLHKATPRSCVLDDCALLEEVQWSVGGTSVDVGITYMKRYGQFRNIFYIRRIWWFILFKRRWRSSSTKNSITRNRHRSISNADVEIVKKTIQIFERHEEVVVVSSDNTDILVLLLYPLLELSLPYQQLMLFAHVWSGWDTILTIFKQGNFS